eukprot:c23871_g1_i3 orf=114-878(+)
MSSVASFYGVAVPLCHFVRKRALRLVPTPSCFSTPCRSPADVAIIGLQAHNYALIYQGKRNQRSYHILASSLREAPANNPGLCESADEATNGYFLQQTMYRIKDPKVSLDFYSRVLGMKLLKRFDFPDVKFSLYFMGYESVEDAPNDPVERTVWAFKCKATLELTHNWGTESDPEFKGYHNGNSEPRGYGHIGITVDDTYKACERFEKLGVEFVKKPNDGRIKGLAFIKDPDGYWIEIFDLKNMESLSASSVTA